MKTLPKTYSEWLQRAREQAHRFWSKVDKSPHPRGCWLWTAGVDKDGYGKFQITGRGPRFAGDAPVQKHVRSHKLAWELTNGQVPAGLVLLHSCDTAACCNPAHLSPNTQGVNRLDCLAKGRQPRIVTRAMALEFVRLRAAGASGLDIAVKFGVARATVYGIVRKARRGLLPLDERTALAKLLRVAGGGK